MNEKLKKAVEIYRSLGYEEVDFEEIAPLGTGSKEEQKLAKEGLRSGEWTEIRQLSNNRYGSVNIVDVDLNKLAIFAIKVGVDAKRAVNVLWRHGKVALQVVAERGEKYAADFINAACTPSRRWSEHDPSVFGALCVHLLHTLRLPMPDNVDYIKDWAFYASCALGINARQRDDEDKNFDPPLEMIESRFREHIERGIALNIPATGPFARVLAKGAAEGLISEAEAKTLVFLALDMAVRPGDRKEWIRELEVLGLRQEDILERTDSLIPLLALGETPLTETFAPPLIAHVDEERLGEVLMLAFSAKSKKTRQMVLKAALERKVPAHDRELAEWLAWVKTTDDKTIANLADKLIHAWNISVQETEEQPAEILGLWQKTPSLWEVPKFEPGECSPEQLTELVAEISNRREAVSDVVTERLLAVANVLASEAPEEARLCFVGLKHSGFQILRLLHAWAVGREVDDRLDDCRRYDLSGTSKRNYTSLLYARNHMICCQIDQLPCILSTPSFEDLSIAVSDLIDRLLQYQTVGRETVLEPDLQLALTRLDVAATQEERERLKEVRLSIQLPDGKKLSDEKQVPLSVSEVVLRYLEDPYVEPETEWQKMSYWDLEVEMPKSLKYFPNRFYYNSSDFFSIFPSWGDYAMTCVRRDTEVYHGQGLILRQVAKRRKPFGKATLINFLAVQSYLSDENAQDVMLATTEAWERGLLLPNTADVRWLGWHGNELSNLASLAKALDQVAQDGILSVVWQVLDDLITQSLKAPRMIAGTAELVKLMERYLAEVFAAIEEGRVGEEVLNLRGVSALAAKKGSSVACATAQKIVGRIRAFQEHITPISNLPQPDERSSSKPEGSLTASELRVSEETFEEAWKLVPKPRPMIEDGIELRVDVLEGAGVKKLFIFTLQLPEIKDREYKIVINSWMYALESEGQTDAVEVPLGTPNTEEALRSFGKTVWLHWDERDRKMAVSPYRNWREKKNGPLDRGPTLLPLSLLTVVIGLLAQDGDMLYGAPRLIHELIESGQISEEVVRHAVKVLLSYEAMSPAKLVRVLEKEPRLLSVLWVMLVECIRFAGEQTEKNGRPPTWVNRVLDICLYHVHHLKEAMRREWIPPKDAKWEGLINIAKARGKSVAKQKAERLLQLI